MTTFESSSSVSQKIALSQKIAPTTSQPMLEPDSATQEQQKSWDIFIFKLVNSQEPKSLWIFLNRTLCQLRLNHSYDPVDVVLETHKRTLEKIASGEKINNLPGWFRKVAFFILQELYRKEKDKIRIIKKLENIIEVVSYPKDLVNEDFSQQQVEMLIQGWNSLNEIERRILILKEVEELSWKDIAIQLVYEKHENDDDKLVDRVRKKGNRALHKLRRFCECC
jgi:DNA-directed RNA polymerase specialized sigma24 family protein